jgi:hypothetical protein
VDPLVQRSGRRIHPMGPALGPSYFSARSGQVHTQSRESCCPHCEAPTHEGAGELLHRPRHSTKRKDRQDQTRPGTCCQQPNVVPRRDGCPLLQMPKAGQKVGPVGQGRQPDHTWQEREPQPAPGTLVKIVRPQAAQEGIQASDRFHNRRTWFPSGSGTRGQPAVLLPARATGMLASICCAFGCAGPCHLSCQPPCPSVHS